MRMNGIVGATTLNAVLLATLVWLWSDPERFRWTEPTAVPLSLESIGVPAAAEPAEIARYRETLERPLFAASRRVAPRPKPGDESQEDTKVLEGIQLLGAYGSGSQGGIVISRGGKVERLPMGASLGGWKVVGEDGRGAVLTRASGERHRLEMALKATPPATPPHAAAGGEPQGAASMPSAAAEGLAGAAAGVPEAPQRPRAAVGGAAGKPNAAELRRQQLERINARRAARGLPPISAQ